MIKNKYYLGLDFGTSASRACLINQQAEIIGFYSCHNKQYDKPNDWLECLYRLIRQCTSQHSNGIIQTIAIDATSASLLLSNQQGQAISPALMYNNGIAKAQAEFLATHAPEQSAVHGPYSSLAKLLYLYERHPNAYHAMHQSDWLYCQLTGKTAISDYNNCLKLGYDPVQLNWPAWLKQLNLPEHLFPRVYAPGQFSQPIKPALAHKLGLAKSTLITTGTTDSTAAVWACGIEQLGEAMTSLGSTLVVKIISDRAINNPAFGVYSHRFKNHFLVGGASNSGAAVLRHFFTIDEIKQLSTTLNPKTKTGLDYYPLLQSGERFPINDSDFVGNLHPPANSRSEFLQALLEGITAIETKAYARLAEMGAPTVKRIVTCGGGSQNPYWTSLRSYQLQVPVQIAEHQEASYGSALIAQSACH